MGEATRWVSLSAGLLLEAASGTSYAFGLYSDALKTQLNYTQSDITTVGSIGNLGMYSAFLGGFTYDRFGPLVTGWGGGLLLFLGYFLMFLGSKQVIPHSVGAMGFYCFLWGNGCSWVDVTAITTQATNFPDDRGKVMGVMKSFFGLSASFFSIAYACFFKPHATPFLLFLAVCSTSMIAVFTLLQRRIDRAARKPLATNGRHRLVYFVLMILSFVTYLATVSVLIGTDTIEATPAFAWVLIPLLMLVFGPLTPIAWFRNPSIDVAAVTAAGDDEAGKGLLHDDDQTPAVRQVSAHTPSAFDPLMSPRSLSANSGAESPLALASLSREEAVRGAIATDHLLPEGGSVSQEQPNVCAVDLDPQLTWWESVWRLEMWLFSVMLLAGTGAGLTLINNIGQVVKAINPDSSNQSTFVAFISIGNCLGRMFLGIGSDLFETRLARPAWITLTLSSMAIAMLVAAFANEGALYVACLWTGFSFGGFFSLSPCLVGDLFGTKAFGAILTTTSVASAIGGFAFSATMAPAIYAANTPHGDGNTCVGPRCFRDTFLILAGACAVAVAAGVWMILRTKSFYAAKSARKERQQRARQRLERLADVEDSETASS